MAFIKKPDARNYDSRMRLFIIALILCNAFILQLIYYNSVGGDVMVNDMTGSLLQLGGTTSNNNPLSMPIGEAKPLPSIRISKNEEKDIQRTIYGGQGDKKHLGGFTDIDIHGISPATWKFMISWFGVKSLLDVGCGRGISTSWFDIHGVNVQCVEGSHDAITKNIIPNKDTEPNKLIEHDFSRGPWWPSNTIDAVWCVEFTEHVGRNYHMNYIPAFRKAALIFMTHSQWGGWHHVEIHNDEWWIVKMESYGFKYSSELTNLVRNAARTESINSKQQNITSPNGKDPYNAQHVWLTMQVFINPVVATLPGHSHLFAEHGCFGGMDLKDPASHKECGTGTDGHMESSLPDSYKPLELTDDMDDKWLKLVRDNVNMEEKK